MITHNFFFYKACYVMLSQETGDTILHIAAHKKDVELARLVCESGADVNVQNVSLFVLRECLLTEIASLL